MLPHPRRIDKNTTSSERADENATLTWTMDKQFNKMNISNGILTNAKVSSIEHLLYQQNIAIAALKETKFPKLTTFVYNMNRYNCIKLDRASHTGGRIAFLKKSSLRYQKRKTNDNGTSEINDLEL